MQKLQPPYQKGHSPLLQEPPLKIEDSERVEKYN